MAWRCPECSRTNEPSHMKCACGYAYYEILGVKEDTPAQSIEQTYRYLLKVWKKSADAQDQLARSKAVERLNNIKDAHIVFLQATGSTGKDAKDSTTLKFAVIGGIGLIIFVAIALTLFSPPRKGSLLNSQDVAPEQQTSPEKITPSLPAQPAQGQPAPQQTQASSAGERPDMHAEKTSDWAIESIKKSRSLDRVLTVDSLVNKWMSEKSGKLTPIGWTARKVEENIFLVSYMATDGITPIGFYFDINTETGEIRNMAAHPDLQQKYGIKVR